jgi:hypothetical protein
VSGARIVTVTGFMHRRQKNMSGMRVNSRNVLSGTLVEIICICEGMHLPDASAFFAGDADRQIGEHSLFEGPDRPPLRSVTRDM